MAKKPNYEDAVIISEKVSHGILVEPKHIKKIKLDGDLLECSFHLIGVGKIGFEGENIVHSDLKNALKELAPHLAVICDLKEDEFVEKKFHKTDLTHFDHIIITGVSIGADGFVITGQKIIEDKVLNLTTPFQKNEDYKHIDDFGETVEKLLYECKMYISGDKFYLKQGSLEFPNDGEEGDGSND